MVTSVLRHPYVRDTLSEAMKKIMLSDFLLPGIYK